MVLSCHTVRGLQRSMSGLPQAAQAAEAVGDNETMLKDLIKSLFKSEATRLREYLAMAEGLIQASQFGHAEQLLGQLVQARPNCGPAWYLKGRLHQQLGQYKEAVADLGRAASLLPDDANCHYELAVASLSLGDAAAAVAHGRKARQLAPDDTRAFGMLAQLQLPGEFYFPLLERIVHLLQPRTYVEIGIFQGDSLKMARSASAVIGIDPAPQISWTLEPHMRVYAMTSDDFFARHDLQAELGKRPVDLAFIDGMHQFEYALRDFANLERHCHKDSVILIHDCYPIDEVCASREPRAVNWCGDIWRLIVLLKKYRPDLHVSTIGTAPSGLAVVRNLDPGSTFLHDNLDRLYAEFLALDFAYLAEGKDEKLNLLANDWREIRAELGRPG